MTNPVRREALELWHKVWITRGARFNAKRRLDARSDNLSLAHKLLSAVLILTGLVIATGVGNLSPSRVMFASLSAGLVGLIQLILQSHENPAMTVRRAEALHENAKRLATVRNSIRQLLDEDPADAQALTRLAEVRAEYHALSEGPSVPNHASLDYNWFLCSHGVSRDWGNCDVAALEPGAKLPSMSWPVQVYFVLAWHWKSGLTYVCLVVVALAPLFAIYRLTFG